MLPFNLIGFWIPLGRFPFNFWISLAAGIGAVFCGFRVGVRRSTSPGRRLASVLLAILGGLVSLASAFALSWNYPEVRMRSDAASAMACRWDQVSEQRMSFGDLTGDSERDFLLLCLGGPLHGSIEGVSPTVSGWATYRCPSIHDTNSTFGLLFRRCKLRQHGTGEPDGSKDIFDAP